jgi:hypothetical protein
MQNKIRITEFSSADLSTCIVLDGSIFLLVVSIYSKYTQNYAGGNEGTTLASPKQDTRLGSHRKQLGKLLCIMS